MITIGSLFSGIGGLELGLEWAGLGPVLWQVECNPTARAVLAQHWPETTRHDDVHAVGRATLAPVGLICGGFPCQDVSAAGLRVGLQGARSGLWFEYSRIVSELRPRWVVVENVTSGAHLWVDAVRAGLERLGYATLPVPLAAADVGASHLRERIFIVATDTHRDGKPARTKHAKVASPSSATSHPSCPRRERHNSSGAQSKESELTMHPGWSSEPDLVRVVHGVSARVDGRRARIAALGNSVVPQCAEVVGWVIRELAGVAS